MPYESFTGLDSYFRYSPVNMTMKMSMSKMVVKAKNPKTIVPSKNFCWYTTKYLKANKFIPALTRHVCY